MGYRPIDPAFREIIVEYRKSGALMNNAELTQASGVCEGTIRYWLKREGMHDLRRDRPSGVDAWRSRIEDWLRSQEGRRNAAPLRNLFDQLRRLEGNIAGCVIRKAPR